MSLEILSTKAIRKKFEYRWPRLCLDQRFWSAPRTSNTNPTGRWNEIRFTRSNFNALDNYVRQQAVYMFVAKPDYQSTAHHSYILYVGETTDLKARFQKYFWYKNSKNPSDQKRRRMVIVWADCLYFNYFLTTNWMNVQRTDLEEDLIDTIAPPMNDEIRSKLLDNYRKALEF